MKLLVLKEIVIELEKKMYELLYRSDDRGAKYYNRVKAITFNLHDKKNLAFRENIINNQISPAELVTMDVKDMANSEIAEQRKIAEIEAIQSRRTDWNKANLKVVEGMHTCENCGGCRTTNFQMQIRGADEPMTL
jgi:DNA-directed RNA polymerase subunit M/transcription elongation factor TFIIS